MNAKKGGIRGIGKTGRIGLVLSLKQNIFKLDYYSHITLYPYFPYAPYLPFHPAEQLHNGNCDAQIKAIK